MSKTKQPVLEVDCSTGSELLSPCQRAVDAAELPPGRQPSGDSRARLHCTPLSMLGSSRRLAESHLSTTPTCMQTSVLPIPF